jgi:hypothetical protein
MHLDKKKYLEKSAEIDTWQNKILAAKSIYFLKMKNRNISSLKVGTNENGSACGTWLSIGI